MPYYCFGFGVALLGRLFIRFCRCPNLVAGVRTIFFVFLKLLLFLVIGEVL